MEKVINLFGVLLIALAVVTTPVLAQEVEVMVDDDVVEMEVEVVEETEEEVDEEVVDDADDFDFDEFGEFDDLDEFGEAEEDDLGFVDAEEGDMTVLIVILVVVALGLIIFLVTRKR